MLSHPKNDLYSKDNQRGLVKPDIQIQKRNMIAYLHFVDCRILTWLMNRFKPTRKLTR